MSGPYSENFYERIAVKLVTLGYLEIREDGSIWRLKRQDGRRYKPRRIDSRTSTKTLHRQVRVTMEGETHNVGAHRLIWQFFKGDIPEGLLVNHKDGDPSNNRIDNLELMTQAENQLHRFTHLGHKGAVTLIRERYEALVEAARETVSTGQIDSLRAALELFDEGNLRWRLSRKPV